MLSANETLAFLFDKSKNRNLMTNEQISKVLLDDDAEKTITSDSPLKLEEGYQLAIKSVDVKGNKAYLELSKNGSVIDNKVVQPSIDGATMADRTYYFKNAVAGADTNIATIDGIFQISDTAAALRSEQKYDKMSIRNVNPTAMTITMDNKDNPVTLSTNKDAVLMQNIHIKTADQDPIDAINPLRYYIYKAATIETANATAPAIATVPAAAPAASVTKNVTSPVNKAAENVTKSTTLAVAGAEKGSAMAANATANATKTEEKPAAAKQPGFEGIFAITGLLAAGYLLTVKKQ
jgi:S-layer protein (TIGR01567 family)